MEKVTTKTATPPGTAVVAQSYLIKSGATGVWAGKDRQIAVARSTSGDYLFKPPAVGNRFFDAETGMVYEYDGTNWLGIVAPFAYFYGVSVATAPGNKNVGFNTSSSTNFITGPETGYALKVTNAQGRVTMGATVGSYDFNIGIEIGSTFNSAATISGTANDNTREQFYGSLESPLLTILGSTSSLDTMRVGWENDSGSIGNLASALHSVYLAGFLVEVL